MLVLFYSIKTKGNEGKGASLQTPLYTSVKLYQLSETFSIQWMIEINTSAHSDVPFKWKLMQGIFIFCLQVLLRTFLTALHQNVMNNC
jgi:hypothetical protein